MWARTTCTKHARRWWKCSQLWWSSCRAPRNRWSRCRRSKRKPRLQRMVGRQARLKGIELDRSRNQWILICLLKAFRCSPRTLDPPSIPTCRVCEIMEEVTEAQTKRWWLNYLQVDQAAIWHGEMLIKRQWSLQATDMSPKSDSKMPDPVARRIHRGLGLPFHPALPPSSHWLHKEAEELIKTSSYPKASTKKMTKATATSP